MRSLAILLSAAFAAGSLCGAALDVSPDGLDVEAVLAKVRAARAAGDQSLWTIRVRGFNVLPHTIVLTDADHDLEFVGEDGATFSGGVRLDGWRDEGNGVWSAPAPRNDAGEVELFDQLWVDNRRAQNARLPNEGYFGISSVTQFVARTDAKGIVYRERAAITNAAVRALASLSADELPFAQVGVVHLWSYSRRSLVAFDPSTLTIDTESREPLNGWKTWLPRKTMFEFFNVRSAFDAPGEWFLDMKARRVLYRPLPGEDLSRSLVVAPRTGLSRLFRVKADSFRRRYSLNVSWRNLRFAFTSATPSSATIDLHNRFVPIHQWQSASSSDGALELDGARCYSFVDCEVSHTGNYAFRFNDGCMSNAVVNCRLHDLGAGGIWMGLRNSRRVPRAVVLPDFPQATAFNLVSNCTITCGGRYNPEGTGIVLTHCSDTRIVHNDIHDFYYSGVSAGFVWGFVGSLAQRNEIAFNLIYDLGKHVMSDMGGVYTLSTSFGTVVHHNIIHDVWGLLYGGWALYCDQGSEGIVMRDNVCWNTTDAGFHQHFGSGCEIRNNIFAYNIKNGAVRGDVDVKFGVPCPFHFVNNIIYVDSGLFTDNKTLAIDGVWANNVWYDTRGINCARFGRLDWNGWCSLGKESCGVFADPKFVDPNHFDFRLRPDSPALTLGFKPIDLSTVGPIKP